MKTSTTSHLAALSVLVAASLGLSDSAVAALPTSLTSASTSLQTPTSQDQGSLATWRPYDTQGSRRPLHVNDAARG
jgi:hypothetical protein